MGIFGFGKNTSSNTPPRQLNISKEESVRKLEIGKQAVHQLTIGKSPLNGLTSKVALILDYSGSMDRQYRNGMVQEAIEKILPIAMEFDDDGSMEVWIFENGYHRLPDINLDNFYGYVQREILDKRYNMGGTCYAPVMDDVKRKYINEERTTIPVYAVFITDGDNSDKRETDRVITDVSKFPIFWQFVGIGNSSFAYLEKLDDMGGRYVDNANFFPVREISDITYEKLLDEYPSWVANPLVQGMMK